MRAALQRTASLQEEVCVLQYGARFILGKEGCIMMKWMRWLRRFSLVRRCRFCGYCGGGWPDSGECPSCGEIN